MDIVSKSRWLLTALPRFFLFKEDCEVMSWDMLSRCLLLLHDSACLVLSSSNTCNLFQLCVFWDGGKIPGTL